MPRGIDRAKIAGNVITALGLAIIVAGGFLYTEVVGNFLIRHVTSRSLGTLAPGYAASRAGIRAYSNVIVTFGILVIGLGATDWAGTTGAFVAVVGFVMFVAYSAAALAGEVRTYRALKR